MERDSSASAGEWHEPASCVREVPAGLADVEEDSGDAEPPERLYDHAQIYGVMAAEFSLLTLVVGHSSSRVCRSAAKHSSVQSLYGGIRRNVPYTAKTQGFSSLNASPCKRHGST